MRMPRDANFAVGSSIHIWRTSNGQVRIVTREDMINEIEFILKNEGMTLEEFVAEGGADALTDGFHRDLWLDSRDWIKEP